MQCHAGYAVRGMSVNKNQVFNLRKMKKIYVVLFLWVLGAGSIQAQPFNLDTSIHPVELTWKPFVPKNGKGKGRMSIAAVSSLKDTQYYFVRGLSIYSPTYISVTAADKSKPVDVYLHKMNWINVLRKGNTGADGSWEEQFKTEGDFGIKVVPAEKPAKYIITVWTGDEVKMKLPTPFKAYDKSAGGGNWLKKNYLYLIIGALALALVWVLLKRKK
jgi:hypothetical protein